MSKFDEWNLEGVHETLNRLGSSRVGYFILDTEDIERFPDDVARNMSNFIVIAARYHFKKCIAYVALSHLFDEIDNLHEIPVYSVSCITSNEGCFAVKRSEEFMAA